MFSTVFVGCLPKGKHPAVFPLVLTISEHYSLFILHPLCRKGLCGTMGEIFVVLRATEVAMI